MSVRSVLAAAEHSDNFVQVIVCAPKELAMQDFLRSKQGSSIVYVQTYKTHFGSPLTAQSRCDNYECRSELKHSIVFDWSLDSILLAKKRDWRCCAPARVHPLYTFKLTGSVSNHLLSAISGVLVPRITCHLADVRCIPVEWYYSAPGYWVYFGILRPTRPTFQGI